MTYSKPMQMLVDEHDVILSVLEAVEVVASRDEDGGGFPRGFYEQALDFFATFVDKCHHAKEETHLFPALEARGIPREGGPIGCMLSDHEEARAHLAAVRAALPSAGAGDSPAQEKVRGEMLAYAALLHQHIRKENEILFVVGDQRLSAQDKDTLYSRFQCTKHGPLPPDAHENYLQLAKDLRAAAGLLPTGRPGANAAVAATGGYGCKP